MMAYLLVEIKGPIDSRKLWGLISRYGINVTDLDDKVIVHGDTSFHDHVDIVSLCSLFGELTYTYGGDRYEPKKEGEDP